MSRSNMFNEPQEVVALKLALFNLIREQDKLRLQISQLDQERQKLLERLDVVEKTPLTDENAAIG